MADTEKIALFIDADNISAKYGKLIIDTLQSRGEIFIRRIYGNWEKIFLRKWNEPILNYGLLAVQQMDFAAGKNATDMSLTIDAMDVLYQRQATIFAIVSGDSDFTPLAVRLRERGVYVIGIGKEQASASFRSACNEFIVLDSLDTENISADENPELSGEAEEKLPAPSADEKILPTEEKISPIRGTSIVRKVPATRKISVTKTLQGNGRAIKNQRKTSSIGADAKKNSEGKLKVGLTPKTLASTSKIISSSKKISVPLKRMSLSDRFVKCGQNGMRKPKKKLQQIHDVLHESAKAHADANGFAPLNCAGHDLKQKNLGFGIRDFGYSLLHEFISDFPNQYELIRTKSGGRSFRYRCL